MKIANWLSKASSTLQSANISTARLDSQLIAGHVLGKSRAWILANSDHELASGQLTEMEEVLKQRQNHTPLAYLFGQKEFYRRSFIVNESVLVPRPETEDLIDLALSINLKQSRVIDVGCGCGIIGITLALERPDWDITLSDASSEALEVASKNCQKFKLSDRVKIVNQDLLGQNNPGYQLVIANLPYVPTGMQENADLQAEPKIALFSGTDGLDHYRGLFSICQETKPENIITESLVSQHGQMNDMALSAGYILVGSTGLAQHYRAKTGKA